MSDFIVSHNGIQTYLVRYSANLAMVFNLHQPDTIPGSSLQSLPGIDYPSVHQINSKILEIEINKIFFGEIDLLIHSKYGFYYLINDKIIRFKTKSPIIEFKSPVGANGISYPKATDRLGHKYILWDMKITNKKFTFHDTDLEQIYFQREDLFTDLKYDIVDSGISTKESPTSVVSGSPNKRSPKSPGGCLFQ